jgi:hypothetical protein
MNGWAIFKAGDFPLSTGSIGLTHPACPENSFFLQIYENKRIERRWPRFFTPKKPNKRRWAPFWGAKNQAERRPPSFSGSKNPTK